MANYLLLYSGGAMGETQAERDAIMQAWGAWFGGLGSNLVDGGNPFSGAVKSIASNGTVSDGAVGPSANGYSVIKAESLNDAVEKAKGCPVLQSSGQVTVYETFQVM